MTKKHFIAIADILRQVYEQDTNNEQVNEIIGKLTAYFTTLNPNFNPMKFMSTINKKSIYTPPDKLVKQNTGEDIENILGSGVSKDYQNF